MQAEDQSEFRGAVPWLRAGEDPGDEQWLLGLVRRHLEVADVEPPRRHCWPRLQLAPPPCGRRRQRDPIEERESIRGKKRWSSAERRRRRLNRWTTAGEGGSIGWCTVCVVVRFI